MNTYYHARTLDLAFDDAVARVTETLKDEGFGILTKIDVRETFEKKLDADFRPYQILGACNPQFAHQALQAEDKIGPMLPCNVIVQATDDGRTEVAAVDPVASMQAVENEGLAGIAGEVPERLRRAIDRL